MFGQEFFPTPDAVIDLMLFGEDLKDKVIWEPEAGAGHLVDRIYEAGA